MVRDCGSKASLWQWDCQNDPKHTDCMVATESNLEAQPPASNTLMRVCTRGNPAAEILKTQPAFRETAARNTLHKSNRRSKSDSRPKRLKIRECTTMWIG